MDFNAGIVQFLPCLALTTTNEPPVPPPGTNFVVQALDASGTVLQAIGFELFTSIVEEASTNQTSDFIVPFTADPRIRTLQFCYQGTVLTSLTASPHPPTITLTTPNGGQNFATGAVSIAWSANDVDGDPLTYTVEYSTDNGGTWEMLAVDWTEQSLELDSAQLAATKNALVRVTACDGFNTASATSAAAFTVQPHPPSVTIDAPADGSVFSGHMQLFLDATVLDMQDGALDGTNVVWSSDRDGALGAGSVVTFPVTTLSQGLHTITLTATDSAGLTGSAVTHLWVLSSSVPRLSIQVTQGHSYATVSWPAIFTNYVLQSSASLVSGWAALTNNPPVVNGSQQTVTVPISRGNSFFRLLQQP